MCVNIGVQLCTYTMLYSALFIGPGFYQSLQYSRSLPRKPDKLTDIIDGQLYQSLASGGGPLADEHNISVVLNTDGAAVFCSTNYSFWPVLLMINELPFAKRYLYNYMYTSNLALHA